MGLKLNIDIDTHRGPSTEPYMRIDQITVQREANRMIVSTALYACKEDVKLKQNVPGFFGVGTAIEELNKKGEIKSVKKLFKNSLFFRTLVFNSMMSLTKSFFELTSYMESDKEYGGFWKLIHNEFLLTKKMLLKISGFKELMQNEPAGKASIRAREEIVQPLLTIQQFALIKIKEIEKTSDYSKKQIKTLKSLVTRSLFGNINASRNSA